MLFTQLWGYKQQNPHSACNPLAAGNCFGRLYRSQETSGACIAEAELSRRHMFAGIVKHEISDNSGKRLCIGEPDTFCSVDFEVLSLVEASSPCLAAQEQL